jgi:hypothetical protein
VHALCCCWRRSLFIPDDLLMTNSGLVISRWTDVEPQIFDSAPHNAPIVAKCRHTTDVRLVLIRLCIEHPVFYVCVCLYYNIEGFIMHYVREHQLGLHRAANKFVWQYLRGLITFFFFRFVT